MRKLSFRFVVLILFCFGLPDPWSFTVFSQNYRFISFGAEEGLSDNFIYNITQDSNGFLWLGTGEGITRFDGFDFIKSFTGDTLPNSPVRRSFIDSGKRVWFGFDNGSIAILEEKGFRLIDPGQDQRNSIKGFAEDSQGNILVATQSKGLIRIDKEFNLTYIKHGLEEQFISSLYLTDKGEILVGSFDGLFLYNYSPSDSFVKLITRIQGIPETQVQVIFRNAGKSGYYIGTDTEGLFFVSMNDGNSQNFSASAVGYELGIYYSNIQDIYQDDEQNLWLATEGQGVIKLIAGEDSFSGKTILDESSGLGTRYIKDIFEDFEGNLWFASYGNGLTGLRNQYFEFFSFKADNFNNDILSLYIDDDTFWMGGDNGILKVDLTGETKPQLLSSALGLPADKVTAILKDQDEIMWIGTSKNGIYKLPKNSSVVQRFFFSSNSLENVINSIISVNSKLYAATNGGLIIFDLISGENMKLTTSEGLPHNRIRQVFRDSKDNTWIATRSNGIYNIESKIELTIDAQAELEFVSITEDNNGFLWAATNGDGVFKFSEDSLEHYTTANGLKSNFCYSLATDKNGKIWVGHSLGMSRIDPILKQVQFFGVEQGINAGSNYNSIFSKRDEKLIFGTTQGIIIYDHKSEKSGNLPPKLNLTSLKIGDQDYDYNKPIQIPHGNYKVVIDFIGINLTNPERVTYQCKLDGHDDWSEFSPISNVTYERVEEGDYTFLLRACNDKGICTEEPLSLKISIKIPLWKTWWFLILSSLFLIASVFIIIKMREKKQKKVRENLEKLLSERTREVMAQKEELENKNRDITDSINYAQRIQASILPSVNKLLEHFSGGFIFYEPKDIVSGDFYWYGKVWGNKFLIVCGDSTGHGVPGAFMSMIGTTLIKDICARPDVRSPAKLLLTLDKEIRNVLNQNVGAENSNDGMDIIIAEFDLQTMELKISSAMRPIIMYIGGKQVYVKGSRNSVGGQMDDDAEDKKFTEEKFALSKGDIIYMFSDGYPDQFGGPMGKKFKMVRLRNLLSDIHNKPIDEQYDYIKSNFILWKEEREQVDDVLFMGIRI